MRTLLAILILLAGILAWVIGRPASVPAVPHGETAQGRPEPADETGPAEPTDLLLGAHAQETRREVAGAHAAASTSTAPVADARCRVSGRIVDNTGTLIEDVLVRLYAPMGSWPDAEPGEPFRILNETYSGFATKTDAAGRFSFDVPLPLRKSAALRVEGLRYHGLLELGQRTLSVGDNYLGYLELASGACVEGRVLSADGAPLHGAQVSMPGRISSPSSDSTDESGRFLLTRVREGKQPLGVRCQGWLSLRDVIVEVNADATTIVPNLVLQRAGEIGGIVVDEKGKGLSGVWLHALPNTDGEGTSTRTERDGTFTIHLPQDGPHVIDVQREVGFDPWHLSERPAEDRTFGPGTKNIRIVLMQAAWTTFHVVDARTRQPVEQFGIRVDICRESSQGRYLDPEKIKIRTHAAGSVELLGTPGRFCVAVIAPGYAPVETDVVHDPGSPGNQTIGLVRASGLKGRLFVAGAPAAGASVHLESQQVVRSGISPFPAVTAGHRQEMDSGNDGSFVFEDLAAGTYQLQIQVEGSARTTLHGLRVLAAETLDLGRIDIPPGATIRGRILTSASESPVGFVTRLDGRWEHSVTIASMDGSFEFTAIEPGQHSITWWRPGHGAARIGEPHAQRLQLAAGETREIALDATTTTPCMLIVHVLRARKPAPGVHVTVWLDDATNERSQVLRLGSTDGAGRVSGLVEGGSRCDLEVSLSSFRVIGSGGEGIELPRAGRLEHTIEVHSGTIAIELPASLPILAHGAVRIELVGNGDGRQMLSAMTRDGVPGWPCDVVWSGRILEFGECPAGRFDATITFERFEEGAGEFAPWNPVPLRQPYTTKVTIEEGRETRVVVP